MGPDLRIALRMGPPVIATGAPVTNPNVPNIGPNLPMPTPGQTAAQNLKGLLGFNKGCRDCGVNGPSLRDVAPPSWIARMPRWAFWLGGLVGLGGATALIVWLVRRR